MFEYIHTKSCRTKSVLEYFDEQDPPEQCGKCDICDGSLLDQLHIKIKQNDLNLLKYLARYAKKKHVDFGCVLNPLQQAWLAVLQPQTEADFLKIPGIGMGWVDTWYNTVREYQEKHDHSRVS